MLSRNQLTKLKLLKQLNNEIEILKACNHENIIDLHAVFEEDGYIFLLMELCREGSLFQKLKKENRFSEE